MGNITILGAGGFIGTNLALYLLSENIHLTLIDKNAHTFEHLFTLLNTEQKKRITFLTQDFNEESIFEDIVKDQNVIYHLISTTTPATSNNDISKEFIENIIMTNNLLQACIKYNVNKVVFLSSGGTVYGLCKKIPINEFALTFPINSYGIQKITIEKLLYFYNYNYGLDYRVVRLSNPYGPYQRPNGIQGVVTTFIYKILRGEPVIIYGDGSVIRDYIYIDDAIKGIVNIVNTENNMHLYNLGTGKGYSIIDLIKIMKKTLNTNIEIQYKSKRKVDVPTNILDITRYKSIVEECKFIDLSEGITKTAEFLKEFYSI